MPDDCPTCSSEGVEEVGQVFGNVDAEGREDDAVVYAGGEVGGGDDGEVENEVAPPEGGCAVGDFGCWFVPSKHINKSVGPNLIRYKGGSEGAQYIPIVTGCI